MKKRSVKTNRTRRQPTRSGRFRTFAMMSVCGLLLLSGIFFAGKQHFSTIDYGMKNSRLRKQVDELQAEKRRLLLAREVSLSPSEIKKAAMKTGLAQPAALAGMTAQVASATREKALPSATADSKSLILKTAAVSPAVTKIDAVYSRTEKVEKKTKKPTAAE